MWTKLVINWISQFMFQFRQKDIKSAFLERYFEDEHNFIRIVSDEDLVSAI